MKISFKQHLIEQMGSDDSSEGLGSSIEQMDPDELIRIAKLKKSNPKLANIELIKKIKEQLKTVKDPRQRSALQVRLQKLMKSQQSTNL